MEAVRPDLGIGGRQLAAIGKRGVHRRIAMLLEQGDGKAAPGKRVGRGNAGAPPMTAIDFMKEAPNVAWVGAAATCMPHAPSVWNLRDSHPRRCGACSCGGGDGSARIGVS